jgi:hypothetical protein
MQARGAQRVEPRGQFAVEGVHPFRFSAPGAGFNSECGRGGGEGRISGGDAGRRLALSGAVAASNFKAVGRTNSMAEEQKEQLPPEELLKNSSLYREFQAEREEILKHKWIESEKAGHDIGFERALTDWIIKHRANWRKSR